MKFRCFFICFLLMQQFAFTQTANDIQIHDTRDSSSSPNMFGWYSPYVSKVRFDFKYTHLIGSPGAGTYSTLLTIPQWPDNSGGRMHQLGFNEGGIFFRQGWPSATNWEGWRRVLVEDSDGKIGVGTSYPTTVFDVQRAQAGSSISITESSDEGLSPALFISKRSRGTNLNSPNAMQNGNYLGGLSIQGFGTSYVEGARIYGVASEAWTSLANGTDIFFATAANQTTGIATKMVIKNDGRVGVGLLNPSEKFSVDGNVRAKKVIVSQSGWPDYVFDTSYSLRSLSALEKFIEKNKHLPEIPSAKEVEEKGISVGDSQALLLKKIEELTLYVIQQGKEIEMLKKKIETK